MNEKNVYWRCPNSEHLIIVMDIDKSQIPINSLARQLNGYYTDQLVMTILFTFGRVSKKYSANHSWIACDYFKKKQVDLPVLTKAQLAIQLRTIEPQVQIYCFLYFKSVYPSLPSRPATTLYFVPSDIKIGKGRCLSPHALFQKDHTKKEGWWIIIIVKQNR